MEVFAGLDAIRQSATEVPGLPTREQLKQWIVEHDKIEKETEIFDSGELKKLKKFTKGESNLVHSIAPVSEGARRTKLPLSGTCPRRTRT